MNGDIKNSGSGLNAAKPGSLDEEDGQDEGANLSPLVVDAVGKALQAHFRAISDMPLPDRLLVLLAELEARERKHDN
jgi:hypothetical protein